MSERILVVDDNPANRKLLSEMLENFGVEVIEVDDGQKAVDFFDHDLPDAVLMDIMMPNMSGHEATKLIKEKIADRYVPIIFVTALANENALLESLDAGGDDFVSKPVNMKVLIAKLRTHLKIKRLTDELLRTTEELDKRNSYLEREQHLVEYFFDNAFNASKYPKDRMQVHISAASAQSGDVFLSMDRPGGGVYFLLGDFTGHGLSASMGVLPLASVFFDLSKKGLHLTRIVSEINKQLYELLPPQIFLAANVVEIDRDYERMWIWRGGLPDAYRLPGDGGQIELLPSRHMPLGVLERTEFDSSIDVIDLKKDDRFYFITDGVTELHNTKGQMFGEQRLMNLLKTRDPRMFDQILTAIDTYRCETQDDDISLVELVI